MSDPARKIRLLIVSPFARPEIEDRFDCRYYNVKANREEEFHDLARWCDLIIEQEFADNFNHYAHLMLMTDRLRAVWLYDSLTRWLYHRTYILAYDLVFVGQGAATAFARDKSTVRYLPFCVSSDPRAENSLYVEPGVTRDIEIGFAGAMNDPRSFYDKRNAMLQRLADRYGRRFQMEQVTGPMYRRFWNRCRIGVNMSVLDECNFKNFEIPACGALALTNRNPEVEAIFRDGEHCRMYDDVDGLIRLVDHYLDHPDETDALARRGAENIHAHHTFVSRYEHIVRALLADGPGARRAAPLPMLRYATAHEEFARATRVAAQAAADLARRLETAAPRLPGAPALAKESADLAADAQALAPRFDTPAPVWDNYRRDFPR
ncbi:MAG: glycosyltransferase family 1 protein [Planctomycetes bacterium]|nr:glycosyltransferase family 1 protein [Planctomycetota bacterium]